MVPIGNGNLYVEPIYLRAETSQLPELKRVVLVNGNRIAMEPTLDRALDVVFGRAAPTAPTTDTTGAGPPAAAPTPGTPSPAQTPTPRPETTPGTVTDLARQAEAAFERAQAALRNGDLATYQQEINRAQELVRQIAQQTGQ
jgi:uncharacterized membrane protein (UPF0182 family)